MYNEIKFLNPTISNQDFMLQDDGDGPYLKYWNTEKLGSPPTQAQIAAARPAANAALALSAVRTERDRRIVLADYAVNKAQDNGDTSAEASARIYRHALRDFPATVDVAALPWPLDIAALNWPTP